MVGKQYQLYITSVRLIAFAYELKGDVADAAAFNDSADEAQFRVDPGSEENISLGFTAEQSRNQVTQYHQAAPDTKKVHNLSEKTLADLGLDSPAEGSIAEQFHDQNYPKDPQPALLQAAQNGDTAAVEHFLQNGAGIDAKDSEGWTALHKAAQGGCTAMIEYLLLNGANIEAKTNTGGTALYLAVNEGHATVIKALLKHNVRIESKNNNEKTTLLCLTRWTDAEAVRTLLEAGAHIEARSKDGDTALNITPAICGLDVIKVLLKFGVLLEAENAHRWTALIRATYWGIKYNNPKVLDIIKTLLDAGGQRESNRQLLSRCRITWMPRYFRQHESIPRTPALCSSD